MSKDREAIAMRWESVIEHTVGHQMKGLTGIYESLIWQRVRRSQPRTVGGVVNIGLGVLREVSNHLEPAITDSRIDKERIAEAVASVTPPDLLLQLAVRSSGNLLVILQEEPQLQSMPPLFKKGKLFTCMVGAIARITNS